MADERQEFVKNYEHCYFTVHLKKSNQVRAAWLRGVSAEGSLVFTPITQSYKESKMTLSFAEVEGKVHPIIPTSGYFNVPIADEPDGAWMAAFYVSVSPDRQYRKGLPSDHRIVQLNVSSSPHFQAKYEALMRTAGGDSFLESRILADHLARGKGRNFYSARAAVDMVETGEHYSVAFSRHFCVALRPNFRFPALMFNNQLAGVYADGAFYVLDKHLHFRDFFQKKWGVEVLDIASYKGN